jgi:hypothetical protein
MVDAKGQSLAPQQTHLVKPKTRKGKRFLEKRGPKLVSRHIQAACFLLLPSLLLLPSAWA